MTQDLSEFRARHPKHLGEAVGYCKAVEDKITHLQAQIKELEATI